MPAAPMCPSEMPPPEYTGTVDYTITAAGAYEGTCLETESMCFNRYSPYIPMAMTVPSGSVVKFNTADIWDNVRARSNWHTSRFSHATHAPPCAAAAAVEEG